MLFTLNLTLSKVYYFFNPINRQIKSQKYIQLQFKSINCLDTFCLPHHTPFFLCLRHVRDSIYSNSAFKQSIHWATKFKKQSQHFNWREIGKIVNRLFSFSRDRKFSNWCAMKIQRIKFVLETHAWVVGRITRRAIHNRRKPTSGPNATSRYA